MKGVAMQKKWDRHEILQLLTLSATLAGLSITALTIFKKQGADKFAVTIADDILAAVSLFFVGDLFIFLFFAHQKSIAGHEIRVNRRRHIFGRINRHGRHRFYHFVHRLVVLLVRVRVVFVSCAGLLSLLFVICFPR
jgi:hypothetical protein